MSGDRRNYHEKRNDFCGSDTQKQVQKNPTCLACSTCIFFWHDDPHLSLTETERWHRRLLQVCCVWLICSFLVLQCSIENENLTCTARGHPPTYFRENRRQHSCRAKKKHHQTRCITQGQQPRRIRDAAFCHDLVIGKRSGRKGTEAWMMNRTGKTSHDARGRYRTAPPSHTHTRHHSQDLSRKREPFSSSGRRLVEQERGVSSTHRRSLIAPAWMDTRHYRRHPERGDHRSL